MYLDKSATMSQDNATLFLIRKQFRKFTKREQKFTIPYLQKKKNTQENTSPDTSFFYISSQQQKQNAIVIKNSPNLQKISKI